MRTTKTRVGQGLIAMALLIAQPALADLGAAESAYQQKNFTAAFAQFKDLAELGQPTAQYALAVMYVNGEGVDVSNTYAHAWASLAAAGGEQRGQELADKLQPQLTPTSLQISADIQSRYDRAALNARLLPSIFRGRVYQDREPVRPSKPFVPAYPHSAKFRGVQGEVYVEFTVATDGHPRFPRILQALPSGYFEEAVRDSVMRSVYVPARLNGAPVTTDVSTFYRFVLTGISSQSYLSLMDRVRETRAKAGAGDAEAQLLYGMMLAGLPQLMASYDQAMPWFLKAAQAGSSYAQYQIGTGLLLGRGCQADARKGEFWLQRAAQADQPDAQAALAEHLLKDGSNPESVQQAIALLRRASKSGNVTAKLMLAAVLAATPIAGAGDPAGALMLADNIESGYKHDPSLWEVRAAAYASSGKFGAAIRAQAQALVEATDLGWDLSLLQTRQAAYSAGKIWTGDLLAF
jgi:TonB family protein